MNIRSRIKQHPVASFIVLTLGLSFAAFLLPVPPEGAFASSRSRRSRSQPSLLVHWWR
jgi:hypothetical protein